MQTSSNKRTQQQQCKAQGTLRLAPSRAQVRHDERRPRALMLVEEAFQGFPVRVPGGCLRRHAQLGSVYAARNEQAVHAHVLCAWCCQPKRPVSSLLQEPAAWQRGLSGPGIASRRHTQARPLAWHQQRACPGRSAAHAPAMSCCSESPMATTSDLRRFSSRSASSYSTAAGLPSRTTSPPSSSYHWRTGATNLDTFTQSGRQRTGASVLPIPACTKLDMQLQLNARDRTSASPGFVSLRAESRLWKNRCLKPCRMWQPEDSYVRQQPKLPR